MHMYAAITRVDGRSNSSSSDVGSVSSVRPSTNAPHTLSHSLWGWTTVHSFHTHTHMHWATHWESKSAESKERAHKHILSETQKLTFFKARSRRRDWGVSMRVQESERTSHTHTAMYKHRRTTTMKVVGFSLIVDVDKKIHKKKRYKMK